MFTIIGKSLGVQGLTRGQGENKFKQTLLGILVPVPDDLFGATKVEQIVIGDKLLSDELFQLLDKSKGSEIQIQINIVSKVWRNNVQNTPYFVKLLPSPNYIKAKAA